MIVAGMVVAGVGMGWLSQLSTASGYAAHVLPALRLGGLGFGSVFAPAINTATTGVSATDAGAASALVNTMQQVGGSLGTALLSTFAAEATSSYLASHSGQTLAASTHGYTTAFAISAGILLAAAIASATLINDKETS